MSFLSSLVQTFYGEGGCLITVSSSCPLLHCLFFLPFPIPLADRQAFHQSLNPGVYLSEHRNVLGDDSLLNAGRSRSPQLKTEKGRRFLCLNSVW